MIIYTAHQDLVTEDVVDQEGVVLDHKAFMRIATNAGNVFSSRRAFEKSFNIGELDKSLVFISK